MENPSFEIGKRIKILRERKGISRKELSFLINRTYNTVLNYEIGRSYPSSKVTKDLAEVLDTSPEYILYGTNDSNHEERASEALLMRRKMIGQIVENVIHLNNSELTLLCHEIEEMLKKTENNNEMV